MNEGMSPGMTLTRILIVEIVKVRLLIHEIANVEHESQHVNYEQAHLDRSQDEFFNNNMGVNYTNCIGEGVFHCFVG